MNVNKGLLASNVPKDPLHLYLAHQQGAHGTNTLMDQLASNPNSPITEAMSRNLPEGLQNQLGKNLTHQDFYDYWKGKMDGIQEKVKGKQPQPKPDSQNLAVPKTALLKCTYGGTIRILNPNQTTKKADINSVKKHKK